MEDLFSGSLAQTGTALPDAYHNALALPWALKDGPTGLGYKCDILALSLMYFGAESRGLQTMRVMFS